MTMRTPPREAVAAVVVVVVVVVAVTAVPWKLLVKRRPIRCPTKR